MLSPKNFGAQQETIDKISLLKRGGNFERGFLEGDLLDKDKFYKQKRLPKLDSLFKNKWLKDISWEFKQANVLNAFKPL